jgi:hypothetical protein
MLFVLEKRDFLGGREYEAYPQFIVNSLQLWFSVSLGIVALRKSKK